MTTLTAIHRNSSPAAPLRRVFEHLADNLHKIGTAQARIEFNRPWQRDSKA